MDLTSELKRLLGLDEAAQESDIVKALQELIKQKGTSAVSLNSILGGEKTALLGLTPEASDDQIIERIEQIGKQSASVRRSDISRAVNEAIESGKLKPSLKTWGENLASANPESFKTFLVNSSPFVPLGGIISQCERGERALTQSESNVCGLLNLSAKEYLNQKD